MGTTQFGSCLRALSVHLALSLVRIRISRQMTTKVLPHTSTMSKSLCCNLKVQNVGGYMHHLSVRSIHCRGTTLVTSCRRNLASCCSSAPLSLVICFTYRVAPCTLVWRL